jgi:hypothetical protein
MKARISPAVLEAHKKTDEELTLVGSILRFFRIITLTSVPESAWILDNARLPLYLQYSLALLVNCVFFSFFFYYLYDAYQSGVEDSFISLDPLAGNCEEVPRAVTADFLISAGTRNPNYHFQTSTAFEFTTTLFELDMQGYTSKFCEVNILCTLCLLLIC